MANSTGRDAPSLWPLWLRDLVLVVAVVAVAGGTWVVATAIGDVATGLADVKGEVKRNAGLIERNAQAIERNAGLIEDNAQAIGELKEEMALLAGQYGETHPRT